MYEFSRFTARALPFATALLCSVVVPAQSVATAKTGAEELTAASTPAPQGTEADRPPTAAKPAASEWVELFRHTTETSRTAFSSCDTNADDRLSIFEAAKTLHGVRGVRDAGSFRALDTNADGYLQWPEFDRRFRELTSRGSALMIRPTRPFSVAEKKARPDESPADAQSERLHGMLDQNKDGTLTEEEVTAITGSLGLPSALEKLFSDLDLDQDGVVTTAELQPVAQVLPMPESKAPADNSKDGGLPEGFRAADHNLDGALNADELATALARIDPSLSRWAAQIVKKADRSRNGTLGAIEIEAAAHPPQVEKAAKPKPQGRKPDRKPDRKARG